MNRAQAKKLAKAKHPKADVRENKWAIDPETREIARREYMKLKEQEPQAPPPTPEFLEYQRKRRVWRDQMDNLRGRVFGSHRCEIYENWSFAIHVMGSGDTWEEAARSAGLIPKEGQ